MQLCYWPESAQELPLGRLSAARLYGNRGLRKMCCLMVLTRSPWLDGIFVPSLTWISTLHLLEFLTADIQRAEAGAAISELSLVRQLDTPLGTGSFGNDAHHTNKCRRSSAATHYSHSFRTVD